MQTAACAGGCELDAQPPPTIPEYLRRNYWWAYLHPNAVRLFDRQWLVNIILCGNFAVLRDAVLDEFGATIAARSLQVACVYGDFSVRLALSTPPPVTAPVAGAGTLRSRSMGPRHCPLAAHWRPVEASPKTGVLRRPVSEAPDNGVGRRSLCGSTFGPGLPARQEAGCAQPPDFRHGQLMAPLIESVGVDPPKAVAWTGHGL